MNHALIHAKAVAQVAQWDEESRLKRTPKCFELQVAMVEAAMKSTVVKTMKKGDKICRFENGFAWIITKGGKSPKGKPLSCANGKYEAVPGSLDYRIPLFGEYIYVTPEMEKANDAILRLKRKGGFYHNEK